MEQFCFVLFCLLPPQPSQSSWERLPSILWMYLSWLIDIYTLEKLPSGWSSSANPLLSRSHVIGWVEPTGVFELLGGCLIGKEQEDTTCLIVIWRPVPLKDLFSNLWKAFFLKWMAACKELINFHWRFPGRKGSPSFWNRPIWSSWKPSLLALIVSPSVYEGVSDN